MKRIVVLTSPVHQIEASELFLLASSNLIIQRKGNSQNFKNKRTSPTRDQ